MAHSNSRSPFNIGDYIIIDDLEYGYVTDIYDDLRLITSFNAITNTTRAGIPFSSCRPTTMADETNEMVMMMRGAVDCRRMTDEVAEFWETYAGDEAGDEAGDRTGWEAGDYSEGQV